MSKLIPTLAILACLAVSPARAAEVVVGTNAEFMPFEFTDEKNEIVGFDIDIINAVGKAAGFKVSISNQAFYTLIAALESGRIDIIVSGMTITNERRAQVDFSEPYYNAAQVIVMKKNLPKLDSMETIKDKTVAVQLGTTGAIMAEEAMGRNNPNLKQFRKYNEVFSELRLGRIDAVVVDLPVGEAYVRKFDDIHITSPAMSEEQYGIAVKKGSQLLTRINAGLKSIRASGEFDQITAKWFQN